MIGIDKLMVEFGTFYLMFWWVMCILYTDSVRIQARLENLGLWLKLNYNDTWIMFVSISFMIPFTIFLGSYQLSYCYFAVPFLVIVLCGWKLDKIGDFFQSMGACKFCIESHTATILAIGLAYYTQDYTYLHWGFLCASINGWFRTFFK